MTAEPKFVPETAAEIRLENGVRCAIRLADSVGFMVAGATGSMENGIERMVMTPWYDHESPMSQAAEEGISPRRSAQPKNCSKPANRS